MKIDIITLFPEMFTGPFDHSIIKRAQEENIAKINIHNLRDWSQDKHNKVDARPYGGGPGMVLQCDPVFRAVEELNPDKKAHVVLLTPQGEKLKQKKVKQFSGLKHLILICGHYEGVDERIRKHLVNEEISIGDYILTGGEIPAMVLTDAIVRLLPGVFEKKDAVEKESFSDQSLLEYPQYTRPQDFRGYKVPEILLSGDHKKIKEWRKKKSKQRTKKRRPDLS